MKKAKRPAAAAAKSAKAKSVTAKVGKAKSPGGKSTPGKSAAKAPVAAADEGEDPRFAALLAACAADRRLAAAAADFAARRHAAGPRRFGSNGLKVEGKLFAMLVRGKLVVKLPRARVAGLIASGAGEPFDRGQGTPMKEWVAFADERIGWLDVVREAHAFVAAGG